MTSACGPGSPILPCLGPTRCSLLTGIAQGSLAWLASAPSSPRIPRPGAIDPALGGSLDQSLPYGCTALDCASLGRGRNVLDTPSTT